MKITFGGALTLIFFVAMLWHIYPFTWQECSLPLLIECAITFAIIFLGKLLKGEKE